MAVKQEIVNAHTFYCVMLLEVGKP